MKFSTRATLALGLVLALFAVGASSAVAAPPPNDALGSATALTIGSTETGTTTDAVDEGEQVSGLGWALNNTVWYTYTPSTNGNFGLDVCADFGVNVVVMTGSSSPFTPASSGVDGYSYLQQYSTQSDCAGGSGTKYRATIAPFPVTAGVQLKVQISSSYGGPSNTGPFTLTPSFTAAPANDDFASAQPLLDDVLTAGTNVAATSQVGDQVSPPSWAIYGSVWYEYTAAQDGVLGIETCSQFGHNVVPLFGSALGSLTAGNDYPFPAKQSYLNPSDCGYGNYRSAVSVAMTSGQTIRIQISSSYVGPANRGTFAVRASLKTQPANDMFAGTIDLGNAASVDQVGHNYATELYGTNEPGIAGQNRPKMVWYRWSATSDGAVSVDTCDTWGNLTVGVFDSAVENPALGDLQPVAGATDGCATGDGAKVGFAATAGKTYWIAVASDTQYSYSEARFTLKLRLKPANDQWADATDLGSDDTVSLDASSVNATADYDPDTMTPTGPMIGAQYRSSSVWFKWTAPRDTYVYVDTCSGSASGYDGWMTAYRQDGAVPPYYNLLDVNNDDDGCNGGSRPKMPKLSFVATQGQTYWIAVAARTTNPDSGTNFTLKLSTPAYNVSAPQITAPSVVVGSTLTAATGDWVGSTPITYQYQWLQCDSGGSSCTNIAGADQSTYILAGADATHTIRVRVSASNAFGGDYSESSATNQVVADADGDGVGNPDDACPTDARDTGKPNGCPLEHVMVGTQPTLTGSDVVGATLTATAGVASNNPGVDASVGAPTKTINWVSCPEPNTPVNSCDGRGSGPNLTTYQTTNADVGRYIVVQVVWTNDDSQQAFAVSSRIGPILTDTDSDGVPDTLDECDSNAQEAPKTNGCPLIGVTVLVQPSFSGTPKVGQLLTVAPGSAENDSTIDSSISAPTRSLVTWQRCDDALGTSCLDITGVTGLTYTPTAADVGKFLLVTVFWTNEDGSSSDEKMSARVADVDPPVVTPPVTPAPTPFDITSIKLPKKLSVKVDMKSGKFTIKQVPIACPAGGAACAIKVTITAKIKRKNKKLASSTLTVPAGATLPLSGKFSKAGLKAIKGKKTTKATITLTDNDARVKQGGVVRGSIAINSGCSLRSRSGCRRR